MEKETNRLLSMAIIFTILITTIFLFKPYIEADAYTAYFDTNGGDYIEEQYLEEGEKVTRPSDPVREGYYFAGWYQDDTLVVRNHRLGTCLCFTTSCWKNYKSYRY